ncbi:DNA polymerase III subunit delta' [Coxiella endosymbiont of Dermacentor marginatus]|uniref:DNA polymerase III subunit delta' n=1 Tax=Coxiella endosymbiont of Dermacentor marginatus TaxID=1656159 RepID=UPI002221693E|nr:DNA polymerase III subunit delta' [Coxiella endosymbiont of Dermacentor marginatus]
MIYSWQRKQWEKIVARYQKGQMPHALLLSGRHGLGKLTFAKSLAELILCKHNRIQACGTCRGCQLFRVGNHPDFFEVSLKEKSKFIKVAQIRKLIAALNQTSQQDHYQVVILSPAEAMNRAAANAFLKTLEEPSGQVLIILVTHRPETLPQTILSRCQRVLFNAYSDSETLQWVSMQVKDKNKALQLLALANHAPLRAIELGSLSYLSLRDHLLKVLTNIAMQRESALNFVNALLKEDIKLILHIIITFLMDILRVQLNCHDFILNTDYLLLLQEFSLILSQEKLLEILQRLQEACQIVVTGSTEINVQLILEEIFLMLEMPEC